MGNYNLRLILLLFLLRLLFHFLNRFCFLQGQKGPSGGGGGKKGKKMGGGGGVRKGENKKKSMNEINKGEKGGE